MPLYSLPLLKTSVKELAKYIHEFNEFKGYDKVNLLGNSLGGHASLIYTVEHPEKGPDHDFLVVLGFTRMLSVVHFQEGRTESISRFKVAYTFYDPKHATPWLLTRIPLSVTKKSWIRILAMAKSTYATT